MADRSEATVPGELEAEPRFIHIFDFDFDSTKAPLLPLPISSNEYVPFRLGLIVQYLVVARF